MSFGQARVRLAIVLNYLNVLERLDRPFLSR